MTKSKIVSLVPARGGSKRIPLKNIKSLNGKPLLSYVVEASLHSCVDETWVSTDSSLIKEVALKYGAKVIDRPPQYAMDYSPSEDVIKHFLMHNDCDVIVLIEPTHPFLTSDDINAAIEIFLSGDYDSLVTLERKKIFLWQIDKDIAYPTNYNYRRRPRMQDFNGCYVETGGLWITTVDAFKESGSRLSGCIGYYILPHFSIDIDDPTDFRIAECMMSFRDQ